MDIRRILIIFVVAVLFAIFSFSLIDAVYPRPQYDDFCREEGLLFSPKPAPTATNPRVADYKCPAYDDAARQTCIMETKGEPRDEFDDYGCPVFKGCSTCTKLLNAEQNKHDFWAFLISSILGLIAVICGLYLPSAANPLHEWIGTGFMLGGLITIFFGTAQYFNELHRIARPIVILCELILVIFVAYKALGPTLVTNISAKKKK